MASNNNPNGHATTTMQHPLDTNPLSGINFTSTSGGTSHDSETPRRRSRRGYASHNLGRSAPPVRSSQPIPTNSHYQQHRERQQQQQQKQQQQQPAAISASDAKRNQTKQLPRSVRWRLSLGLLTKPTTDSTDKDVFLKSIEDLNALKLRFQRSRYDELEKRHYWKSTPVGIADEANGGSGAGGIGGSEHGAPDANGGGSNLDRSLHHVAPGDDPLSALVMQDKHGNNSNKMGDKKQPLFGGTGGIFGHKDKNNMKSRHNNKSSGLSTSLHGHSPSDGDGAEAACKGSRWADFYSTREVLDVIEKDLIRLPTDQYTIYHEWRMKNKGWREHREKEEKWHRQQEELEASGSRGDLDFLESQDNMNTIQDNSGHGSLVDEASIDSSHSQNSGDARKSSWGRARTDSSLESSSQSQNSGGGGATKQSWSQSFNLGRLKGAKSVENMASLLQVEEEEDEEVKRQESAKAEIQTSITERAARISQILFVYAREHLEIGYRQGMHEVLSNILLALEMDLLEQAINTERTRWRRDSLSFGLPASSKDSQAEGSMAGVDSSGNMVLVQLLDDKYILHDAFNLFECIMTSLAPAYDAVPAGDETTASLLEEARTERGESPMELMTSSIVSKIRFVARDEQLFGHVLYMPVPPQLYFAKWIRLMFGREVAGGMKGVLTLWGAFFDLASAKAASNEEVPITAALLDVLKTAAAAMIILIRPKLLAPSMGYDGTMSGEPDPNVGIGYLMNYPPLKDIVPLVETISSLLAREQKISNQYLVSKERKLSKQYLPSETYKISSIVEHPLQSGDEFDSSRDSSERSRPPPPRTDGLLPENGEQNNYPPQLTRDDLPQVYKPRGRSQNQHPKHDVAESFGHMAEGLIDSGSKIVDFGSKTASAAIASIQKQYEVHKQTVADHPLHNNSGRDDQHEDYLIKYRPHVSPEPTHQKTAAGVQIPMGEEVPRENFLIQQLIDSDGDELHQSDAEDESEDEMNQSVASKLSIAKDIADSIQKNPREMAGMLEKSVGTLMRHFNEQLSADADSGLGGGSTHSLDNIGMSQHSTMIPDEIWDAMADIELVRKELLSQAAITSMDHARSCSSLRSSGNSGSRRRKNSESRLSWML